MNFKKTDLIFPVLFIIIFSLMVYFLGWSEFILSLELMWEQIKETFTLPIILFILLFSLFLTGIAMFLAYRVQKQNKKILEELNIGDTCLFSSENKGKVIRIDDDKIILEVEVKKNHITKNLENEK